MSNMKTTYIYPSGFSVGQLVRLKSGSRKYNAKVGPCVGEEGLVVEPPNSEGWPDDAVQVRFRTGTGALDACVLEVIG